MTFKDFLISRFPLYNSGNLQDFKITADEVVRLVEEYEDSKMTNREKILAANLLELAANEFSNHGCNDVDESVFKDWTIEERREFVKGFYKYNGDPENYDENYLHLGDSILMDYLANKLKDNQ